MTQSRTLTRTRRALLAAPLVLGGLAIVAQPAVAGVAPPTAPNLTITKTAQKGVAPGEKATWTITVTNQGGPAVPVADIEVRDSLIKGLLSPNDEKVTQLNAGERLTYTASVTAKRDWCEKGVTNTATVTLGDKSKLAESRTDDNSASSYMPIYCSADVAIEKTSDAASYAPGDTVRYTVTVRNTGDYDVNVDDIDVDDPALPDLALVVETDKDGKAPQVIAPGESVRYVGSRTLTAAECGILDNTATVALRGDGKKKGVEESDLSNNTATRSVTVAGGACNPTPPVAPPTPPPVTPTPPAPPPVVQAAGRQVTPARPAPKPKPVCPRVTLKTAIQGPGAVTAGQRASWRVTVANTGSNRARGVTLRVAVPSGMAIVGRAPKGARISGGSVSWRLGTLAPNGGVRTVRLDLQVSRDAAGAEAARAFASARCAKRSAAERMVQVAAVKQAVAPAVTG